MLQDRRVRFKASSTRMVHPARLGMAAHLFLASFYRSTFIPSRGQDWHFQAGTTIYFFEISAIQRDCVWIPARHAAVWMQNG